jgi:hypothetical protein
MFLAVKAGQPGTDPEYMKAAGVCWLSPDTAIALTKVNAVFQELAQVAGPAHFLSLAMERSTDWSPAAVAAALGDLETRLVDELGLVKAELDAWNSGCAAERRSSQCYELAAGDALRRAEEQLSFARRRLDSAPSEQGASRQKLQTAGLSAADIAKVGVKPSDEDIAGWREEAVTLAEQVERIKKFFASRPNYDVTILTEADLARLGYWQASLRDGDEIKAGAI